jgi:sterol 14-demethylase
VRVCACLAHRAWNAAIEEQKALIKSHGEELTYDALMSMEVLQRNITEALRMHPPLILLMRYAKQPFSVTTSKGQTFNIPKVCGQGWLQAPLPVTHSSSKV